MLGSDYFRKKPPGVPYIGFVNWTRVRFLFFNTKQKDFRCGTLVSSIGKQALPTQFYRRGKLSVFTGWKCAICEFIHGCFFIQWTNFGYLSVATFLTLPKLFEIVTYNNAIN
ncbi:MAG: hypothetical protein COA78_23235 [Blastopirellula sp.]|nr:MAG: hypothetical protein COA78_23235 [Blastopirellula sp.]